MTEAEIKAIVNKFAELAEVLRDADPDDKAEVFCQLALKLTYHPRRDYLANGVSGGSVSSFRRPGSGRRK